MTAAQLKSVLKPLTSFSDTDVDAKILLADPWFDTDRWGSFYLEGLANWVCHFLVLDSATASTDDGAEVSGSVGDESWSLHPEVVKAQVDNDLIRTRYGQRYVYLANLVGIGGVVA